MQLIGGTLEISFHQNTLIHICVVAGSEARGTPRAGSLLC
jgi:hypothetical protein